MEATANLEASTEIDFKKPSLTRAVALRREPPPGLRETGRVKKLGTLGTNLRACPECP
jgi:hypothetical protein